MKRSVLLFLLIFALLLSSCANINVNAAQTEVEASSLTEAQNDEERALAAISALETQSGLTYRQYASPPFNAPKMVAYKLYASHQDGYSDYIASVYDMETQQGKVLCAKKDCTHDSESCDAFIRTNRNGRCDTDTYTAFMRYEADTGLVLTKINFDTCEKTSVEIKSNEAVSLENMAFNSYAGYAFEGNVLYMPAYDGSRQHIVSIDTSTGAMKQIFSSDYEINITTVSGDALIVSRTLRKNMYTTNPNNYNVAFEEILAVTKNGEGVKRLRIAPSNYEYRFMDGASGKIYYLDTNYYYDKDKKAYTPHCDGVIHSVDMITGDAEEVGKTPVKWGYSGIEKSYKDCLLTSVGNERYKINLSDGSAELFTAPHPNGISTAQLSDVFFYGDNAIVQNYSTFKMYTIPAADYLAGKANFTELEGSEITKEYG